MFKTEPGDKKVHYYDGCLLKRIEYGGIYELCGGHYIREFYFDDEEYIWNYAKEVTEEEALEEYLKRYSDKEEFYKHYFSEDEVK